MIYDVTQMQDQEVTAVTVCVCISTSEVMLRSTSEGMDKKNLG